MAVGNKFLEVDGSVPICVGLAELLRGTLVLLLATGDPILHHATRSKVRYDKINLTSFS